MSQIPTTESFGRNGGQPRTFCFDIDGVIASITPANQYDLARPITGTVELINYLYDNGHKIVLFTARGGSSGIDWKETTIAQLETWGVKYHQLRFDKPSADYYIDDKFIEIKALKKLVGK